MFPTDPDSEAFPLYEYTILDDAAISIDWSPSNDLCVLVHQDNSLEVCRAGITPIWSTSTLKSAVTCVSWHPNGQEFVFGCQDGTVYRLNTAQLTPDPISCWPPSNFDFGTDILFGISSLLWIDYSPNDSAPNITGFDPNAFDMENFFPSLSMVPPEEPIPLLPFQRPKKILCLNEQPESTTHNPYCLLVTKMDRYILV
ncbi:hypothetical protein BCR42DRAFT_123463 [Absidia repens]|uniref:Anaphase-promoting complex subunit 4-like WD40 domain-containing protein n=1 Tax=Absidia repens TaxID=90262 RepID=A0A1X2I4Q2_9FUNG|nr:hypothetical protein BCR42DRAFT_123463 [Absidia repens]